MSRTEITSLLPLTLAGIRVGEWFNILNEYIKQRCRGASPSDRSYHRSHHHPRHPHRYRPFPAVE